MGFAFLKEKELESTMLHEVVPQAPLEWPPPLRQDANDDGPTWNGMHVLLIKWF
jgi:hypothetical protein